MSESVDESLLAITEEIIENGFTIDTDPENGNSMYHCKQCDFKTTSVKGVRIHISNKHKKQGLKRAQEIGHENGDEKKPKVDQNETNVLVENNPDENDKHEESVFGEDDGCGIIVSTQKSNDGEETLKADDIIKLYEGSGDDELTENDEEIAILKDSNVTVVKLVDDASKTNNDNGKEVNIPDDTIDEIMRKYEEPDNETCIKIDLKEAMKEMVAENLVLKSKLSENEASNVSLKLKIEEADVSIINTNLQLSKISEEFNKLKDEHDNMNDENQILISTAKSKEEELENMHVINAAKEVKIKSCSKTIEKLFKENKNIKSKCENQLNTIELMQKHQNITNIGPKQQDGSADETIKKLNAKIKIQNKTIDEIKEDKKRLGNELAELQDNVKKNKIENNDEKYLRLTNVIKKKSEENKKLFDENKALKITVKELQNKLNNSGNKSNSFEDKVKLLEGQISNLLEACGEQSDSDSDIMVDVDNSNTNRKVTFDTSKDDKNNSKGRKKKCKFNDKGLCHFGPEKCHHLHSTKVCESFSKYNTCGNEETCLARHPTNSCKHWMKGNCAKGLNCFFRHPVNKESEDQNSVMQKRKRTLSQQLSPQQNKVPRSEPTNADFLYKTVQELQERLNRYENHQIRPAYPMEYVPPPPPPARWAGGGSPTAPVRSWTASPPQSWGQSHRTPQPHHPGNRLQSRTYQ